MTNKNITITALEAETLRSMISDGFFFDDLDSRFITWGVSGKQYRACQTTLAKKGIVSVDDDFDGCTATFCGKGWDKDDIMEISGWYERHPEDVRLKEYITKK